jgi:hypothetical protein
VKTSNPERHAPNTERRTSTADCDHTCGGYWINKQTGQFRCYGCQYQNNIHDLPAEQAKKVRPKIEVWTAS